MSDDKGWTSVEEAIQHIMKSTGCSRRVARKKLARHIKKGELPLKKEWRPDPPALPGPEAARRLQEEPETVLVTLGDLMQVYCFTSEELLGELRSGRLVAGTSENTLLEVELSGKREINPFHFSVRGDDLKRWLYNPKTPEHLVAKISASRLVS